MANTNSIAGWRQGPAATMAALGLVSGAATVGWTFGLGPRVVANIQWLEPVAILFGLSPELLPIGLFFGAAIALGVWLRTANLLAVPVLLVVTTYAWSAAIQVAIRMQRTVDDDPHLIAASLAAGAVGAGITHLGCAIFSPPLRRPARIALTTVVGALAGMLLFASQRKYVDEWLLYVVWQPAVAFCIGMGLARGPTRV
jgi:hypothetical protein